MIKRVDSQIVATRRLYDLSCKAKDALHQASTDSEKQLIRGGYADEAGKYARFTERNLMEVAPLKKLGVLALMAAGMLLGSVVGGVLGFFVGALPGMILGGIGGAGIGLAVAVGVSHLLFGKEETHKVVKSILFPRRYSLFNAVQTSAVDVEYAAHDNVGLMPSKTDKGLAFN